MPMPERRARLMDYRNQMLELLASKGFAQVGMRELAACLGLSAGALYHHYPSKQDVLFDLIEELYEELLTSVASLRIKAQKRQEKLNALISAHLRLHAEMPWHFRLAERDIGCLTTEQQSKVSRLREQYERALHAALGNPSNDSQADTLAATRLIAKLLNSTPTWLTDSTLDQQQRDELLHAVLIAAIGKLQAYRIISNAR